jgi:hypothetical protein
MDENIEATTFNLKYWWILASAVSFFIGAGIVTAAVFLTGVGPALYHVEKDYFFWRALLSGSADVVVGMVLGFGQWLVLRHEIRRAGGWILATMLGFGLGNAIGSIVGLYGWLLGPHPMLPTWDLTTALRFWATGGAVCGLILGSAQWLVLRQVVRAPGWWIPINIVSWAIGTASGWYTGGIVMQFFHYGRSAGWAIFKDTWYESPVLSFADVVLGIIDWPGHLVVGILVGAMTGLALAWMLKRPIHNLR